MEETPNMAKDELESAIAKFANRVAEGNATPEEMAFMDKVIEWRDAERLKEIRSKAFHLEHDLQLFRMIL